MGERAPECGSRDSVEYIFWLSASKFPKADNARVLKLRYSKDMERLIKRGIKQTKRPSEATTLKRRSRPTKVVSDPCRI